MKLKQEFSLLASLLVVIVVVGISSNFFIYEREFLIKEMKNNEINIFESFIEMSNEALSLHDELLLLNYINLIKKINKNIVYMIFKSADGHMLSVPKSKQLHYVLPSRIYFSPSGEEICDMARPVIIDGKEAGVVQIGFSQDILKSEVKKTLKKTGERIFGIALIALVISILASLLLANTMTKPIKKLTQGAKLIGDGNLEQRIIVKSANEFGDLAEEFNKMALKLKELDEIKDNFISSVSHELKSPLSYIKGYIDLFLAESKEILSKEHSEYFTVIKNNINRLSNFISDILDLAKIKAGHIIVKKEPCNLRKIAMEIAAFCKPGAEERKITITVLIPEDMPQISCDIQKINQVLNNLLGNALKFTQEGGKIEISTRDKEDNIEVCVSDSGIGIPEEELNTVFEKFQQVKANMDKIENVKGTGLGLAIVKGIIDTHGEKIWVESELNKGSRFIFTLSK